MSRLNFSVWASLPKLVASHLLNEIFSVVDGPPPPFITAPFDKWSLPLATLPLTWLLPLTATLPLTWLLPLTGAGSLTLSQFSSSDGGWASWTRSFRIL